MSANNNLHRTSEESKAQEENEEEEETYDDDTSEEDDHVDDDSEEIPELVPRDESISNSGDDTENETDEDTEDEIRVRVLPSMMLLQLVQLEYIYEEKYKKNEDETRSVYTSPETVDVIRILNGWTLGRPLMDLYFRPHHESPSIEFNQLSYGRNIDSDSDESDE